MGESSHEYTAYVPALGFPPLTTCGLAGSLRCALPLEGSVTSIKWHLRMHGHRHPQRQPVQCPWVGCSDTLQWINMARHIKSIHLGVRFRCPNCDRLFTRPGGLANHTASLKCYGQCLFCIEKHILNTAFRYHTRGIAEDGEEPTGATCSRPHWIGCLFSCRLLSLDICTR